MFGRGGGGNQTDRQRGFIDPCLSRRLTVINVTVDAFPDFTLHHSSPSFLCPSAVLSSADLCGQISNVRYVLMDTRRVPRRCSDRAFNGRVSASGRQYSGLMLFVYYVLPNLTLPSELGMHCATLQTLLYCTSHRHGT